jgi:hypothetical protein
MNITSLSKTTKLQEKINELNTKKRKLEMDKKALEDEKDRVEYESVLLDNVNLSIMEDKKAEFIKLLRFSEDIVSSFSNYKIQRQYCKELDIDIMEENTKLDLLFTTLNN